MVYNPEERHTPRIPGLGPGAGREAPHFVKYLFAPPPASGDSPRHSVQACASHAWIALHTSMSELAIASSLCKRSQSFLC